MKLKDILFEIEQNYNPILKNSIVIKTWKGPEKIANDLAYLLRKKINQLYGFEAYIISKTLNVSISMFCNTVFSDFEVKSKNKNIENRGKVSTERMFIEQFTIEQQDVAMKAGIPIDRLNKILNGNREGFYAYEVLAIAKSQKININKAFDQLYKARYDELVKLSRSKQ